MTEAASSPLPVIVKRSRRQDVISLLGSLIVMCIGGCFQANQGSWTSGIVTGLFALSAIHFSKQVFNGTPRLIISEDGINEDLWNSAMMPWSDFKAASLKAIGKAEYLCLFLNDPEGFRRHTTSFRRGIHTATRETGPGDIMVSLSGMGLNAAETVSLVRRQIELAKSNPKPASAVKYPTVE